jgi:ADP-ribose pyrophosphatase
MTARTKTGYSAARMEDLGEFWSSPGMVTESYSLYRAHGLVKVSQGGGTESENITVHHVPLDGIARAVADWRKAGYAIDTKLLILLAPGILARTDR